MRRLLSVGLSLLSAVAYFFTAFSPLFVWIAPIPLLWMAFKKNCPFHYLLCFLAYFAGNFLQFLFIYSGTIFPIRLGILPLFIEALIFTLILWLVARIIHRSFSWVSSFIFPAFWVTYEYFSSLISKGSIAGLSIFFEIEWLPVIQIVSITGLFGLVFLTALFASGLALYLAYRKEKPKEAYFSLFLPIGILVVVILFGVIRLQNPIEPNIRVGLAAKNPPTLKTFLAEEKQSVTEKANEVAVEVEALAKEGAHYILLPEQTFWVTPENQRDLFGVLQRIASENSVYLLAPMNLYKRNPERNAMLVFSPEGKEVGEYFKMHPVQGFEKAMPGDKLVTLQLPHGLAGLEICHDMDYFQPIRDYSKMGVGLLFVPAADFGVDSDGRWHAQVAILQSVANGCSLARAAYFGFLSASDSYGRILAWKPTVVDQEVSVVVDIPVSTGQTFYAKTGNWFPWLNLALSLFFLKVFFKRQKGLRKDS